MSLHDCSWLLEERKDCRKLLTPTCDGKGLEYVGEEKDRAFGSIHALMGLFSLPAPIFLGLLYDIVGFQGPVSLSFLLALSTLFAIYALEER